MARDDAGVSPPLTAVGIRRALDTAIGAQPVAQVESREIPHLRVRVAAGATSGDIATAVAKEISRRAGGKQR